MQSLIDDLLKLSRITRDEMRREHFDLSELAGEIGDYLQAEHPDRTVEFHVDAGIMIHADRNLMRIAMDNLLRNAWKFTAHQSLANIHVGCLRDSNQPVYFVEDNRNNFV